MVRKVRPSGKRTLRLRFAGDRRQYDLDLTGLIARSRHFAPLMEDAETFAKIDIIGDGLGVAWPLETNGGALIFLDQRCAGWRKSSYQCRARTLRSGENRWVSRSPRPPSCSLVGRRTIMGYLKKNELPPVVAIACRALARDKLVFAAHYVPARKLVRHVD